MVTRGRDLTELVTVRFNPEVAAQLDELAKDLVGGVPGIALGRADVIRVLVAEGLARRAGKKKRKEKKP